MRLKSYKAAVFDMDGVIFDSERLKMNCWIQIAAREGIPDIEATFQKCLGINFEGNRQVFLETYGEDFDFMDFRKKSAVLYHQLADDGRLPKKPGIEELLSFLKENGIKIGVASSTREELVRQQIMDGGLAEYFDVILGGDNVKKGKPDPEIYIKACALLDTAPEEAFAIEDSFNGVRSGYSARMDVIMVPDLVASNKDITRLCLCVQENLYQVIDYLKKDTTRSILP